LVVGIVADLDHVDVEITAGHMLILISNLRGEVRGGTIRQLFKYFNNRIG
jgi:hypothetical protein